MGDSPKLRTSNHRSAEVIGVQKYDYGLSKKTTYDDMGGYQV